MTSSNNHKSEQWKFADHVMSSNNHKNKQSKFGNRMASSNETERNNEMYVNGLNIAEEGMMDTDVYDTTAFINDDNYRDGIVVDGQGEDTISYGEKGIDHTNIGREGTADNPDHDTIDGAKSIDHSNLEDTSKDIDNDIQQDADDNEYYDEYMGMDGLGTDVGYDEGSTSVPGTSSTTKNKVSTLTKQYTKKKSKTQINNTKTKTILIKKTNLNPKKKKRIHTILNKLARDEQIEMIKDELSQDSATNAHSSEEAYVDSDDNQGIDNAAVQDGRMKREDEATGGTSYEYAILVKGGNPILLKSYTVISASGKLHMVELSMLPDLIPPLNKVYAYSVFDKNGATMSVGPVKSVNAACMMMAEFGPATIDLAISNPAIEFQYDPKVKSKERCTRKGRKDVKDPFSPKVSDEVGVKMMFCTEGKKTSDITVPLRIDIPKDKLIISIVKVIVDDGKPAGATYARLDPADITTVIFSNLVNGFTTEISIIYLPKP
ncbi:hypothetical protein QZH41_000616 [Actinostola sp. cb2023]|nr:hypothetical protein QZH41_000616 [Actinostola sp. cb2023]